MIVAIGAAIAVAANERPKQRRHVKLCRMLILISISQATCRSGRRETHNAYLADVVAAAGLRLMRACFSTYFGELQALFRDSYVNAPYVRKFLKLR